MPRQNSERTAAVFANFAIQDILRREARATTLAQDRSAIMVDSSSDGEEEKNNYDSDSDVQEIFVVDVTASDVDLTGDTSEDEERENFPPQVHPRGPDANGWYHRRNPTTPDRPTQPQLPRAPRRPLNRDDDEMDRNVRRRVDRDLNRELAVLGQPYLQGLMHEFFGSDDDSEDDMMEDPVFINGAYYTPPADATDATEGDFAPAA